MTKRESFNALVETVEESNSVLKDELIQFLNHEIELLDRKTSRGHTETKRQKENAILQELYTKIITESETGVSIPSLIEQTPPEYNITTSQRIVGIMNPIVKDENSPITKMRDENKKIMYVAKQED